MSSVFRFSIFSTTIAIFVLFLASCGSSTKKCYEGFCEITENGVTRYEGDPEKIAEFKAKAKLESEEKQERQKAFDQAPKRKAGDPVRVALLRPTTSDTELRRYRKKLYQMLRREFKNQPNLELVSYKKLKPLLKLVSTKVEPSQSKKKKAKKQILPNENTFLALRELGLPADVLIFMSLHPKEVSVPAEEQNKDTSPKSSRIEIRTQTSTLFKYHLHTNAQVGKSSSPTPPIKEKSSTVKTSKRNLRQDKPAIKKLAKEIHSLITEKLTPTIPTLSALDTLQNRKPATEEEPEEEAIRGAIQSLFGE